ncbi:DUF1801 domain-containing protein [Marinomonas sp. M1K-6]|uniref:DUF1801 domain-containing protein n=1 Tax=Marinomonas profundi TaxID=2726122 RepID=A0A847QZJ9_9GAMM|nr:DUF1801 domain-containing protein [Marinomonas profundi]NLQ16471.1 DUF1801 domain-containing protein [Marinomonas profundi]UDV03939.1 DUF1801 domain-containing protein [Marinomonas profundi]
MSTLTSSHFVRGYVKQVPPAMQADLLEVICMMEAVAPEAELVSNLGIPYFQQNGHWLYGVAVHEGHFCVYFSDLSVLYSFSDRLPRAQFGDDCLIIHNLDDINLNVLAELFGQIKVHSELNHPKDKASLN